jgi:hypothetical protein
LIYDFVKYNIQTSLESNNLRRIHITGSISPINADVYSGFVVDTALKDLGRNPEDYVITFSKSTNFMARIEEVEYLKILNDLFGSDKQVFEDYYTFDPKYRIYNINVSPTEQDQITLHRIFVSSGIIPETSSPDTLLINLTWTDQAYYNH